MSAWVFGYASLVADLGPAATVARLHGHRREWGVATDNTHAVPGYKVHLSRVDGSRPAVFVAFYDVVATRGDSVNGVAREVDEDEWALLDERERNYERVEVTDLIEGVEGSVWTYRGTAAGRERLRLGRARGAAVVSREYDVHVRRGFDALGLDQAAELERSADRHGMPLVDLEGVPLGPGVPEPTGVGT